MKYSKNFTRLDHIKFSMGVETLTLIGMLASHVDKKKANSTRGLMGILNIIDHFNDSAINDYKFAIKLKINLFGKEFVEECCYFAILLAKHQLDTDIFKMLGIKDKRHLKALEKLK